MELAKSKRSAAIRTFLLTGVKANSPHLIQDVVEAFKISRQAVNKRLDGLVKDGFLIAEGGKTKSRTYKLGPNRSLTTILPLKDLKESDLYQREFNIVFGDLPKNLEDICHYGFTEILNNAIDHSGGERVFIRTSRTSEDITIRIGDDGKGIFKHITRIMHLSDPREAILELSKGKITTDLNNHSGKGIFFTSRVFDIFVIISGDLIFNHHGMRENDYLLHDEPDSKGTTVIMKIAMNSSTKLSEVFNEFYDEDGDYVFNRTVVPLRLALFDTGNLISRSQAKRILFRIENFKYVKLDFTQIEFAGHAFLDEVFRVFARKNPQIELTPINATNEIDKMIRAAINYNLE